MTEGTFAQILLFATVAFLVALLPIGQNATNITEHLSGVLMPLPIYNLTLLLSDGSGYQRSDPRKGDIASPQKEPISDSALRRLFFICRYRVLHVARFALRALAGNCHWHS